MAHYNVERRTDGIWLLENEYHPQFSMKTESIFTQCNGYMGVRASQIFPSCSSKKGMFVRGLFNRAYKTEAIELVNCPDLTKITLKVNQEEVSLEKSRTVFFQRALNLMSGELAICQKLELMSGLILELECRRAASFENPHIFQQKFILRAINHGITDGELITGIDGQQTNSGVSHFCEVDCRVHEKQYLEMLGQMEGGTLDILSACSVNGTVSEHALHQLKRRGIEESYRFSSGKGEAVVLEKWSYVQTGAEFLPLEAVKEILKECVSHGYDVMLEKHKKAIAKKWNAARIKIDGISLEDEAAICFAQYHLMGMVPWDTGEYSIAAKGLTGEGYKGHVFWDTEIFMLPFFMFTFPKAARSLLEYRCRGLDGARKKAEDYGYKGSMFPWQAAVSGQEETPLYAALNIHTGKANKIWSGIKEHHVTADIVYAIIQYYQVTGDHEFMNEGGYEIVFEAAAFWVSRAEKAGNDYVIRDIIGPDEYTEHIDNNAYTNYMAKYCVDCAVCLEKELRLHNFKRWLELNLKLDLYVKSEIWKDFSTHIYLPRPDSMGIIPQDDTFLSKKELPEIERFRNAPVKQTILTEYSRDEVVNMQVLKQADIVMLLNLFPHLYSPEIVKKNILYYEKRTIHDSSLSYCAHAQACALIGEPSLAWEFFQKSLRIDLNDNPNDSTDGVHAASLGGIWNCLIYGFAGIQFENHILTITPNLPINWKQMNFFIYIKNSQLEVTVGQEEICLKCATFHEKPLIVEIDSIQYTFNGFLKVKTHHKPKGNQYA